jgi:hypothetical protein
VEEGLIAQSSTESAPLFAISASSATTSSVFAYASYIEIFRRAATVRPSVFSRERDSPRRSARRDTEPVEIVQERLRLLEIDGVEALGEPAVDVSERRARLLALPLIGE